MGTPPPTPFPTGQLHSMYTRPLCQENASFSEKTHILQGPPHTMVCQGTLPWEPRLGQGTGQGAGGTEKTREPGTLRGRRRPHATGSPELGSMAGSTDPPPTARQRGRSSRRPAGTAGSPGDQAGGRRLAVLGRLRVPP